MSEPKKRKPAKLQRNAEPLKASNRTVKGPEPERLIIRGYKNWQDAIAPILGKRKPPGGWPK